MEWPSPRIDQWAIAMALVGFGFLTVPDTITLHQFRFAIFCWIVAILLFISGFPAVQQRIRSLGNGLIKRLTAIIVTILLAGSIWSLLGELHEIPQAEPERATAQSELSSQQQFLFSSIPSYIVSAGDGVCGLFMSLTGHNTESDPVIATPIAYLLWVRLLNNTDFKMLVDGYLVQLSDSESGPWVDTFQLPINKWSTHYCNYSGGDNSTKNTGAFHAALEAVRSSPISPKLIIAEGYTVATSSDLSCSQKCTPLDIPDLASSLTTEIEPHTAAAGWVAVNPSLVRRPTLAHHHEFYRLTAHTATGDLVSSGRMGRKTGTVVYRSDAYLRLEATMELPLRNIPLAYVGALEKRK